MRSIPLDSTSGSPFFVCFVLLLSLLLKVSCSLRGLRSRVYEPVYDHKFEGRNLLVVVQGFAKIGRAEALKQISLGICNVHAKMARRSTKEGLCQFPTNCIQFLSFIHCHTDCKAQSVCVCVHRCGFQTHAEFKLSLKVLPNLR